MAVGCLPFRPAWILRGGGLELFPFVSPRGHSGLQLGVLSARGSPCFRPEHTVCLRRLASPCSPQASAFASQMWGLWSCVWDRNAPSHLLPVVGPGAAEELRGLAPRLPPTWFGVIC